MSCRILRLCNKHTRISEGFHELLGLEYGSSTYNGCYDDNAVANYINGQFSCYDDDSCSKHKTTDYSNHSICFYKR